MDGVNKILNDFISIHNKNFDFCPINCEFVIGFYNNFTTIIETSFFDITDIININRYLLCDIDCFKSRVYTFCNINQMTINIISDRCNMTYEHYMNQPMSLCEPKINLNIAKNPKLINSLDQDKNDPLIRKHSHIPFHNYKMYIKNITNDYDNITDYDNTPSINCTNSENNIEIVIPLITIIPCGMSLVCLISLMVYTLIKPLIRRK